eukprot:1133823-Pelagomonas_calceolata.AAC.1
MLGGILNLLERQQQQHDEERQQQQQREDTLLATINTNGDSIRESIQGEIHGLRQQQQQQQQQQKQQQQQVDWLLAVERGRQQQQQQQEQQQQQQEQQRKYQGLGTEAEEAAKWNAETVADAPNKAQVDHLVLVSASRGEAIQAEQAAGAVGAPMTAVSKHQLPATYTVN